MTSRTQSEFDRLELMQLFRSMTNSSSGSYVFDPEGFTSSESTSNKHNENHGLPDFEYDQITSKGQSIRLLKLIAGTPGNPTIDCELVETQLHSPAHTKYEALSWCWGTLQETAYIRIRGKKGKAYAKKAKPDLVNALLALRSNKWDRYLWIDAVCINQEDMDEKNQQVEMMAEIYGKAKRVCVWLGQPDESSRLAIKFIRDEILKLQDFDDLCDRESNSPKWKALLDLMQRPWFSRRWVVQEISLAQKALLYCGLDRISWNKFSVAVELFVEVETATHRLSEVMKKDRKFHHIPGWFDYVSQLGASLLVDATGRLFRDHKDTEQQILASERRLGGAKSKHITEDSDSEGMSDDSGEEEGDSVEPHALVSNGHGNRGSMSSTNGARPNRKAQNSEQTSTRASEFAATVKGQPLLGLEVLVSSLAIFDVTKAHDTIYALLAISKDTTPKATKSKAWKNHTQAALEQFTEQRRYEVDYKKPYVDVCQYFIKFCIHRALKVDGSRALDLILRPWAVEEAKVSEWFEVELREQEEKEKREAGKRKKAGPSMGPQLTALDEVIAPDDKGDELRRDDYVPLPSWIPQLSKAPFAMQRAAGVSGPKVGRTNADPLVGVPNQNIRNYKAAETKELDIKTLKFRKRVGYGKDNYYSMFVKGFVLDTITEVKDASQSGNIPSDWADFAGWARAQGDPPDAFWRTLVGDRGRDGKNPPVYYARACKESFEKGGYLSGSISTSDLIRNERVSVIAQFCWRVQSVIWKRALAKTESGRLALVTPGVKEGDLVCILYGCSVPVILRMSDEKTDDQVTTEAKLELEVLRIRMTRCAKTWLARTKHYQNKRCKAKAEYRVWEMTKKLLFFKDSKWRTEWKRKREQREKKERPGSKREIATRDRFERPSVVHTPAMSPIDKVGEHRTSATGDGLHNGFHAIHPQRLGHQRALSEWDYIAEKIRERKLTMDDIRKRGFKSQYEQHLQACEFDDWKREKRMKARELRERANADPTAPIESSWAEPTVNWREFELRLRYGRLWRKILRDRRQEEEEIMMKLRDTNREERGFKLRERPAKKQVRLLDTEEVELEDGRTRTKLTENAKIEVEGIWLENVRKAMRNEKREEPSEVSEDSDEDEEGSEHAQPSWMSARTLTWRSDQAPESNTGTVANQEKSRQSYRYSYQLLGDCYLHGMMDGEAMAAQNGHSSAKAIPAVVFEIR